MKGNDAKVRKEALWLVTPRQTPQDRDKVVCSNCGGNALYDLDNDLNIGRAFSMYCPHCGSLILSSVLYNGDEE